MANEGTDTIRLGRAASVLRVVADPQPALVHGPGDVVTEPLAIDHAEEQSVGPRYEMTQGIRHHTLAMCDGEPCPFHAPSLHPMIEEPMLLRESMLIERVCKHGVGHPDPDSVAWFKRHGRGGFGIHGCDGCCSLPDPKEVPWQLIHRSSRPL